MSVNVKRILHLITQILAQSAVIALIPPSVMPYVSALLAIIGVIIAFQDPAVGMAKAEANIRLTGNIYGKGK